MDLQIVSPPEMLKPFVKYFWTLSNPVDSPLKTLSAFPDGSPGIIMVQSEGGAICDNGNKKLPDIYLHGQTVGPSKVSYHGKISVVGVSFQPHALKSIFGIDANELTHTGIDFRLIQNKKHGNLAEQIVSKETAAGKISLLSDYLLHQQQNNDRQTEAITQYALSLIIQSKGNIPIKELHQRLQLSERSLQRKFNQSIGISPKLFSRICRFQQSLNQLRTSSYDRLSDIAYENEYADQSHLVRAFKEFTGLSPLAFKKSEMIG
jgi:AraC-like DNA-binding protein